MPYTKQALEFSECTDTLLSVNKTLQLECRIEDVTTPNFRFTHNNKNLREVAIKRSQDKPGLFRVHILKIHAIHAKA